MAEGLYDVRILDPAQGELEEIMSLYTSLAGIASARKIADKIYTARLNNYCVFLSPGQYGC